MTKLYRTCRTAFRSDTDSILCPGDECIRYGTRQHWVVDGRITNAVFEVTCRWRLKIEKECVSIGAFLLSQIAVGFLLPCVLH